MLTLVEGRRVRKYRHICRLETLSELNICSVLVLLCMWCSNYRRNNTVADFDDDFISSAAQKQIQRFHVGAKMYRTIGDKIITYRFFFLCFGELFSVIITGNFTARNSWEN